MRKRIKPIVGLFLSALFLYSCTDDYFEFDKIKTDDWRPELAVPLINSSLSLSDILLREDSNGIITTNPDGVLEIVYDGRVFSTSGATAVTLPNQNYRESVAFPNPLPTTGGTLPLNTDLTLSFDNGGSGLEADNVLLKDGNLIVTLENEYQHRIIATLVFPSITDASGDSLVLNYNIPPATAGGVSVRSQTINLAGNDLNMTKDADGNPAINKIPVRVRFQFQLTNGVGSSGSEEVRLVGALNNLDFKEFTGYVGNSPLELDIDSIPINIFENFKNGSFFLSNPFVNISILNSYGVPMNLSFQSLRALNSDKNPNFLDIQLPQNPIDLNSPSKYGKETTSIMLDNMNSNVASVVSYLLKQIEYDAVAQFNPTGPPPANQRNFISDTSNIALDVELRLPFEGYASGFFLVDTIDFNFEVSDELDNGLIRVIAENSFPVAADFQIVFVDSAYNPIDSLYSPADTLNPNGLKPIIPPSIVDANGETIQSSRSRTDVSIEGERLNRLVDGKYVLIKAELNTVDAANQQNIRFKPEYNLDISLGLKAKILID